MKWLVGPPYRTQIAVGRKDGHAKSLAGTGMSRSRDFHSVNRGRRFRW
jgi:hypothetical protein